MTNETAKKSDLVDSGLKNLTDHLGVLVPMLEKAAAKFRVKEETESNRYYIECIDSLKLFSELIEGAGNLLQLDYSEVPVAGGTMKEKIDEVAKKFEAMHSAQDRKDWVTLSDILEYELAPAFKEWIAFLPAVREEIQKQTTEMTDDR